MNTGEIRLGVGEGLAGAIVPTVIAELHRRSPQLRITLSEGYTEHLLIQLLEGRLDLVAGAPPASMHGATGIEERRLYTSTDVVLARASHPLARKKGKLKVSDLVGFSWLVGPSRADMYEAICSAFVEEDLEPPRHIIWSDAIATGLALLLRNDYPILAAEDILLPLIEAKLLAKIDVDRPTLARQATLFYRQNATLTPAAELFANAIVEASKRSH